MATPQWIKNSGVTQGNCMLLPSYQNEAYPTLCFLRIFPMTICSSGKRMDRMPVNLGSYR